MQGLALSTHPMALTTECPGVVCRAASGLLGETNMTVLDKLADIPKGSTIACRDVIGECGLCGEPLNVKYLTGVYCGIIRGVHELSLNPHLIVECPMCFDRIWHWQFPVTEAGEVMVSRL